MAQRRRSAWFWVSLLWLAALMFSNWYDERLVQGSTLLPGELGNVAALALLLVLSYFYTWSHRWVGGALAVLGVLAVVAALRATPVDAAVAACDLACAAGLIFAPFRPVRAPQAATPPPPRRYQPRA